MRILKKFESFDSEQLELAEYFNEFEDEWGADVNVFQSRMVSDSWAVSIKMRSDNIDIPNFVEKFLQTLRMVERHGWASLELETRETRGAIKRWKFKTGIAVRDECKRRLGSEKFSIVSLHLLEEHLKNREYILREYLRILT